MSSFMCFFFNIWGGGGGGCGVCGTRVATWHFTEIINYIGIFTQSLEVRVSHFQLCEPFSTIRERITTPKNIVFMIFIKYSPKRAHLYIFRYLREWNDHGTRIATWHFTKNDQLHRDLHVPLERKKKSFWSEKTSKKFCLSTRCAWTVQLCIKSLMNIL